MSDLEDEIERIKYQRSKDKFEAEQEEAKRLQRYNERMSSSGCCIIALMCVFTGLASVGFAKSLSDNAQVKQPEPQPATLVSKSNVTPTAHKNLIGEHIKN